MLEFAQRHGEVSLDLDYADHHSKLIEEGIDLAIRVTRQLAPGDVARKLGSSPVLVVAAPQYLARHGEPAHPSELIHHECLAYTGTTTPHRWSFQIGGRLQGFEIRTRLQANNGDALVQAAVAGFGLNAAPEFLVVDELADGRLRRALTEFPLAELGIYGVLPGNRHIPHRVRVLLDFLAARLGAAAPWRRGEPAT